jgi:hypothetical protein
LNTLLIQSFVGLRQYAKNKTREGRKKMELRDKHERKKGIDKEIKTEREK